LLPPNKNNTGKRAMVEITHRRVEANGIGLHIAEAGQGPLVLFCHGFPETSHSWRRQLRAVAAAGYHAVAPDMRGYGLSDRPAEIDQYTIFHLVGDIVALVQALGAASAVIVGHDWGAPVAWTSALLRPDLFKGVAGLSVPYRPRGSTPPTTFMPSTDTAEFYQLYFQTPGVAEAELERDVRLSLRKILTSGFNSGGASDGVGMVRRGQGFLDAMTPPPDLPAWLTQSDLDTFEAAFTRSGFAGGLNWYRNLDRNWSLLAPFTHRPVEVPALFMVGDRDLVYRFPGMAKSVATLSDCVPKLTETIVLPGCGHWIQQERAEEVTAAIVRFLGVVGC
jgi:pimeloyl-ACP methyl ester carboxylesterase